MKTLKTQDLAREIAAELGILEVYNNTDDVELDNLIKKYVQGKITETEFRYKAKNLIEGYMAIIETDNLMFERNIDIAENALNQVMIDYSIEDEYFYHDNHNAIVDNMDIQEEYRMDKDELYQQYYVWIEDFVVGELGYNRKSKQPSQLAAMKAKEPTSEKAVGDKPLEKELDR